MYWIVSVPSKNATRDGKLIQEIHARLKELKCDCAEFKIPKLKVKTMEQLFVENDDLVKLDSFIENVLNKLLRTWSELAKDFEPHIIIDHSISNDESVPPAVYINYFQWDEGLPFSKDIKDDLQKGCKAIQKFICMMDDSLKTKMNEYSQVKAQLATFEKKKAGNLSVKGLEGIVKDHHIINSEYLATLFVAVQKAQIKEWQLGYEDITDEVVPDSSELIVEDKEYALFSVVLLRKGIQDFESECRKRKYVVRTFEYDEEQQILANKNYSELEQQKDELEKQLLQWCRINYSDCFATWIHVKAVRVYIETVLRFGPLPKYVSLIVRVNKNELKAHKYFRELYRSLDLETGDEYEDMLGNHGVANLGTDFCPYVLVTLNTSNALMRL